MLKVLDTPAVLMRRKYRVSQKNGDLEFLPFFSCVRARLYDNFQKKSTSKSKLGVFSFHMNVDLFLKWSYNRALTKLKKDENSKSPFFWGHPVFSDVDTQVEDGHCDTTDRH